jgi:hypothetical protein
VAAIFSLLPSRVVSSTEESHTGRRKTNDLAANNGNSDDSRELVKQKSYSVDYYDSPKLQWMANLFEEQLFDKNAVTQSPWDDGILYVTTHSGKLYVLSTIDGKVLAIIEPPPRTLTSNGTTETWAKHSSSGVAFGTLSTGDPFLCYTLVDQPNEESLSLYGPKT